MTPKAIRDAANRPWEDEGTGPLGLVIRLCPTCGTGRLYSTVARSFLMNGRYVPAVRLRDACEHCASVYSR